MVWISLFTSSFFDSSRTSTIASNEQQTIIHPTVTLTWDFWFLRYENRWCECWRHLSFARLPGPNWRSHCPPELDRVAEYERPQIHSIYQRKTYNFLSHNLKGFCQKVQSNAHAISVWCIRMNRSSIHQWWDCQFGMRERRHLKRWWLI